MPNFQNGKIYSIRSHMTERVYVGSTTQPLSVRFGGHKLASNTTSSAEIVRLGDSYIELIEAYPCATKDELNRREGEIIRSMDCVNKRIAGRKPAEYYEDHREEAKQRSKQYRATHLEEVKQYYSDHKDEAKQYHQAHREEFIQRSKQNYQDNKNMRTCVCGASYNVGKKHVLDRHYRSQKHVRFVSGFYERLRGN